MPQLSKTPFKIVNSSMDGWLATLLEGAGLAIDIQKCSKNYIHLSVQQQQLQIKHYLALVNDFYWEQVELRYWS